MAPVTPQQTQRKSNHEIDYRQQKTHDQDTAEMLVQQLAVLCNVPVVEIGYSKIEQDIEEKGEIENCKVESEIFGTGNILHCSVDAEDPEWLDQQVK